MQSGKQSEEKMKISAHPIVGTWNLQSFSELDVRSALYFSALLRLPGDVAPSEITKLVDFTIERLGL